MVVFLFGECMVISSCSTSDFYSSYNNYSNAPARVNSKTRVSGNAPARVNSKTRVSGNAPARVNSETRVSGNAPARVDSKTRVLDPRRSVTIIVTNWTSC